MRRPVAGALYRLAPTRSAGLFLLTFKPGTETLGFSFVLDSPPQRSKGNLSESVLFFHHGFRVRLTPLEAEGDPLASLCLNYCLVITPPHLWTQNAFSYYE